MSSERKDLGIALRALRTASGLTGATVARRACMSAGKLSKIENGRVLPTVADVDLILTALDLSGSAKDELLRAARFSATEATAWRVLRRMGPWKHQQSIQAVEAQTTTLRLFQGQLIPGLLQIPEYIAAVFTLLPEQSEETRSKAASARLERQRALYDQTRRFEFLICEHVLRWLISDRAIMAMQLDRLVSLSRLPNVNIGVIPLGRKMPDFPMTCYSVYDERLVIVETFHSQITTRDPADIRIYLSTFDQFSAVALYGDEMRSAVECIRDEYLREQETG
ncbi:MULTISPECIES: helix-turn-helix domain-containing protein [unclassified Streptomyces]|uniref:helix-turn-helix domain-containing protein n=1 Tax=unclassified Streptomyces TaxID=2593676 RepID=UPI002E2B2931|nr:helix-turn-helix transcriptional regulator [Streptomyces sp. NBC_00223]